MEPNTSPDADFDLDLRVVTDVVPQANRGCDTSDGCAPSCASSCTSRV